MGRKNVQISYDLFIDLVKYHLTGMDEPGDRIKKSLEKKLQSLSDNELYTRYKTAQTEDEREEARIKYLDSRGVRDAFRW